MPHKAEYEEVTTTGRAYVGYVNTCNTCGRAEAHHYRGEGPKRVRAWWTIKKDPAPGTAQAKKRVPDKLYCSVKCLRAGAEKVR